MHGNLKAESEDSPWSVRSFAAVGEAAEAAGLTLLPVRTNLWELLPDLPFVSRESLSSGLAATAHLFRRRWTRVSIATGLDVASEVPRGTHPMLDPLYGSSAVDIRHDPIRLTRLERLAELAAAPLGVARLVVCLAYPGPPRLNCGECEKCVRTMTQLLAIGRLEDARSFPHRDVSPERIRSVPIGPVEAQYYVEALPGLAQTRSRRSRRGHRGEAAGDGASRALVGGGGLEGTPAQAGPPLPRRTSGRPAPAAVAAG